MRGYCKPKVHKISNMRLIIHLQPVIEIPLFATVGRHAVERTSCIQIVTIFISAVIHHVVKRHQVTAIIEPVFDTDVPVPYRQCQFAAARIALSVLEPSVLLQ